MANVTNQQTKFFYIYDFRQGVTYAYDFNIQTHTHTEMDKPVAIGEIWQICLKITEVQSLPRLVDTEPAMETGKPLDRAIANRWRDI